jgi:hypothetical protein
VDRRSPEPKGQFSVYHFEGLVLGLQTVLDEIDPSDGDQIARIGAALRAGKFDNAFLSHCGGGKNSRIELNARKQYFANAFQAALR